MAKTNKNIDPSTQNRQYMPSLEEQAKLTMVNTRYELGRTNQQPYWTDFDRYYKMYESYVNENREIYSTKMFVPIVFSVIERYLPRIISSKPTVNFMPRLSSTDFSTPNQTMEAAVDSAMRRAQKMQALQDWQWDQVSRVRDGGMYMEILRFVKEALIVGTAVAKIPWRLEQRNQKYYNLKGEVATKFAKYFDGPDFELIDPYDFFFDPESIDLQRASWVIHRTRKTLDEMQDINAAKGTEIYKNLDILQTMTPDDYSATENDWKLRRKTSLGSGQVMIKDRTTDKYELMECWGMFPTYDKDGQPTKDQKLEPRVIVVANRAVVVRDIPYPYWHGKKPFVSYTPWPRDFEFYGVPIIKHLERIQFYTNEFVNQKFDNQVMSLNSMIVIDPSANVEDWQLVWRPGGVIRANPAYIKPLQIGDATPNIDASLNYMSQVTQLTTGLSDYYTGGVNAEQTSNKTASGTNTIEEQIAARVKEAVQVLEAQVIHEIGYQWHGLNAQFIKLPQLIRVIGQDGQPDFPLIEPEDARFEYDIIVEQGSTEPINKSLLRQQFVQALQMVSSNPLMAQITDWHSVEMELWKMFGQKQPEKLMTSTGGMDPTQMMGQQGQGQPAQGLPGVAQNTPQMMAQNMNGQIQNPQYGGPGRPAAQGVQGTQSAQSQKPAVPIRPKFDELTMAEQNQVLQILGIQPDQASRAENMANQQYATKAENAIRLMKQFQIHPDELGGVMNSGQG